MELHFEVNIAELFAAHCDGSFYRVRAEEKNDGHVHLLLGEKTNVVNMRERRIELLDSMSRPGAMIPCVDFEKVLQVGFVALIRDGEKLSTLLLESWLDMHMLHWKVDSTIYASESIDSPCCKCAHLADGDHNAPGEDPFRPDTYTNHYVCPSCGQRWERYSCFSGHWSAVESFVGPARPTIVSSM